MKKEIKSPVVAFPQPVPVVFVHWSVDEVAECAPGIDAGTYKELWRALERAHAAGSAKALGGDGTDGTIEEPVVSSGEYGSDLVAAWPSLSAEAQLNIIDAAARLAAQRAG